MKSGWMLVFSVIGVFVLLCTSCEEEAPRLRSAERKIIDSLAMDKIALIKIEMDSLCGLGMKARVDYAVDSIMVLRIEERKKRLGY